MAAQRKNCLLEREFYSEATPNSTGRIMPALLRLPDNLAEVCFDDLNKGTEPKKHPIFLSRLDAANILANAGLILQVDKKNQW